MYTNQDLRTRRVERDKLFSTCALLHGEMFSFTSFKRIPIKIDLCTGNITLLEDLTNYDPTFIADYMLSFGDDIFVLELNGNRMLRYNTKERYCSYFDINCNSKNWNNYAAFAYFERSIYIFPTYTDGVVKIDLELGEVVKKEKLYSIMNEYKDDIKNGEEFTYFWQGCQQENKVWLFQRHGNLVVAYDMEADTWKEYRLSVKIKDCIHVMLYEGYIYILSAEGTVYRWKIVSEAVEKIVDCSSNKIDFAFSRIAVTDRRIFMLPSLCDEIYYIDYNTKYIKKYDSYPSDFRYCGPKIWSKYYGVCEDDERYFFAMRSANYILSIHKKTGREEWIKTKILSYEEYKSLYISYNKKSLSETECGIEDILLYLQKELTGKQGEIRILKCNKIWEYVRLFDE